jgi:hypothetical protein
VLPWSWRHSHEERRIPSLRAHLEKERHKASRRVHYIHERSHGGGGAHYLRGGLSEKLRAHIHEREVLLEEGRTKAMCAPSQGGGRTCVEGTKFKERGKGFHKVQVGKGKDISKAKVKGQGKRAKS